MAPFYGWGSTASRLQPLRGGSLLFTIIVYLYFLTHLGFRMIFILFLSGIRRSDVNRSFSEKFTF